MLKIIIPLVILFIIIFEGKTLIKDINIQELKGYIQTIGFTKFLVVLLIGIVCVLPMCFYDISFVQMLKIKVPLKRLIIFAWSSNVFTNFIGLGGIAGAALRTFYYKKYVTDMGGLVKSIAKLTLYNLSGLSILSWFVVFGAFETSLLKTYPWIIYINIGFGLYLPAIALFIYFRNRTGKTYMTLKVQGELLLVSIIEWCFLIVTIWGIAHIIDVPIGLLELAPVFIIAACAGNLSMIPGGLGSFDLIFLMGFSSSHIPTEQLVLVLALYRFSYYVFPWLIGAVLFLRELWVSGWRRKVPSKIG
ncbi:lysylphosphatidylglycerol synthase domain-containing protein [Ferdinandcohnia quinoae]|nr:lysylphosphatidylglycerol synthase domain-containing protein [Fredinandcohnia sp. SECRCQ15]